MRYLAFVLLVGFMAVGAFGFVGMNHDMSHNSGCIAMSANSNVVCPQEGIASALYHTAAYRSFSEATIVSALLIAFAALLALLESALARSRAPSLVPIPISRRVRLRRDRPRQQKFFHWLSLFENSPSCL